MRLWSVPLYLALLGAFALAPLLGRAASEDPGGLFLQAYMAYRNAQRLEADGRSAEAIQKFRFCASVLEQLQKSNPDYEPVVVDYRLRKSREAIARVSVSPDTPPDVPPLPAATPVPRAIKPPAAGLAPAGIIRFPASYRLPMPGEPINPLRDTVGGSDRPTPINLDGLMSQGAADALKKRIRELQMLLSQEKRASEDLRRQVLESTAREQSALTELDRTKVRGIELQARIDDAQRLIDDLQRANLSLTRERDAGAKRIEELQADLEVANEYNGELFTKLERAANFIESSEKIRTQLLAERQQLAQRVSDRAGDGAKLAKERDAARAAADDLQRELDAARKQAEAARAEAKKAGEAILRDTAQASASDRAALEKRMTEQQQAMERLATEKAQEIERIARERDAARQKAQDLEQQLAAASKAADEAGAQSALALAKQAAEAELAGKERAAEIAKLSAENARLAASAAENEKQSAELNRRNKELADQLDVAEQRLTAFADDRGQRDKLENDLRGQIGGLEKTLNSLRDQLGEGAKRIAELEKQLADTATATATATGAMAEENALLKSIVTKQLAEQARRQQTRKLVTEELEKLQLRSGALVERLQALSSAEAQLTPKEQALFQVSLPTARGSADFVIEKKSPTSDLPTAYVERAREANQLSQRGQYAQALAIYREIAGKAPDSHFANLNLGVVARQIGDYPLAISAFQRALRIKPGDALTLSNLGMSQFRADQGPAAVQTLKQAVAADPENHLPHYFLALALNHTGAREEARNEARRSLELKPDYLPASELMKELDGESDQN